MKTIKPIHQINDPIKQVVQPTVVDATAFHVWKDEAFELWHSMWASAFAESKKKKKKPAAAEATTATTATEGGKGEGKEEEKKGESERKKEEEELRKAAEQEQRYAKARAVLSRIRHEYWLVNVVDNNYQREGSAIFDCVKDVIVSKMSQEDLRKRCVAWVRRSVHARARIVASNVSLTE